MIAYASRTGTRHTLAALRSRGWGILVSATGPHRSEGFERYCLDNGAWTFFQKGEPFNSEPFERLLVSHGAAADFAVVPDIVEGGLDSLRFSRGWLPRVLRATQRALIAVQDGMRPEHIRDLLSARVGIFVGGSTEWKEKSLPMWGELARATGAWFHVGRVNTSRRIFLCEHAGADSFDGSSVSRFACTIGKLDNARRQQDLFGAQRRAK